LSKNRILLILIIGVIGVQTIFARPSYELDLYYGIGYPDFSFNNAPISVSIYPWRYVGFSTGVEYSARQKKRSSENIGADVDIIDNDGDQLIFTYHIDKYKEKLSTKILHIPILLKYRSNWFYTAAGVKIGIPQDVNVQVSYEGLVTEGYLPELYAELKDLPHLGFASQPNNSFTTEISAKTLLMLAGECGVRIRLGGNFALLLGAFADYSLNKSFDRELQNAVKWIEYIDEASITVGDSWKSWQPWGVGGAAKLSFGFGGTK
jgi:hypothetical protein